MGFFSVSKLIWFAFAPSHLLAWMCIASAILLFTKYDRLGRRLSIASAVLFVLIGILPLHTWLIRPLENEFPRPQWPSHVDGVLTLGGGLNTAVLVSRDAPAMELSEARLVSTYELARLYPNARIIFSGGSGQLGGTKLPEAQAARYIFGQMGLETGRLTFEDRSHNTWENILYSQKIAKPRRGEVWLLATSAIHMPRAMGVAKRLGWEMVAWPTDYLTARKGLGGTFEVAGNLSFMDYAVHEWLGLLAYHWTGKTLPVP